MGKSDEWIEAGLKRRYAKLLGELERLEKPPKYETRLSYDRMRYAAEENERCGRIRRIREELPHLEYMVRVFDDGWDIDSVKPIRPKEPKAYDLTHTARWGVALDLLRESRQDYSIGEMTREVAARHGIDVSTSDLYEKLRTAINNGLKDSLYVKQVGGRPKRFVYSDPDEQP